VENFRNGRREGVEAKAGQEEVVSSVDEERSKDYEGGLDCVRWLFLISLDLVWGLVKGTHYFFLLDRDCTSDIPSYFQACPDEHRQEVVGFVFQYRLVDLDDNWDGIQNCSGNGEREVGVIQPDGVVV
jgi:hypothetical protein